MSQPRRDVAFAAAALGGVLYFLGYLGWGVWPCLLAFLAPLWAALDDASEDRPAVSLLLGLTFGLTAYAGGFLWLWYLVASFLDGNRILGAAIWLAWGLWFAAGFVVYAALFRRIRRRGWPIALAGVAPLVVVEWLQPQLFPLYAGAGLVPAPLLVQTADFGGPLLLTALLGASSVVVLATWTWWRGRRPRPVWTWMAGLAIGLGVVGYGWLRMAQVDERSAAAPALRVGIVQANLGLIEKETQAVITHRRHLEQTRELLAGGPLDLVVWPETSYVRGLRRPLPISGQLVREDVTVPLLFGAGSVYEEDGRRRSTNSAFLVGADGMIRNAYDKNLLIPLAEYAPLAGLFPWLGPWFPHVGEFVAASETPALALGPWRIAAPICYEVIRPEFVRRMVRASDPHLLVTQANDAWFGDSHEPWLHLGLAQLRAVEHRRYLVRATNSGVSAVVDPAGRVVVRSGLLTRENLRATVHPLEERTVYARLGDWPGWLALALVALALVFDAPRLRGARAPDPEIENDSEAPHSVLDGERRSLPRSGQRGNSMTATKARCTRTFAAALLAVAAAAGQAWGADAVLSGDKLVLTASRLMLLSRDTTVGIGAGEGSADDPVVNGGSLRVVSIEGDVFDTVYPLPAADWRYVRTGGTTTGYAYRGTGLVRSVRLLSGNRLKIRGRGALGHTLGTDPAPVRVVLTLGAQQYCLSFGGTISATPNRRFRAEDAPAPDACPMPYPDDKAWACRPGMANNQCFVHDLDATDIAPDLTETLQPHVGNETQPYDCFYVYPTVDLSAAPANHTNYLGMTYQLFVLDPLLSQAAPFTDRCRVFAPHYRQVTLGTFGSPNAAQLHDFAYRDVIDAWRLYLKYHNGGRNVVIMGHSQGTMMLTRLVSEEVDPDPVLRSRLITALLIGFDVAVPPGQVIGGTFQNLPLCTTAAETGCVIAYRTYEENHAPVGGSNDVTGPGLDNACTNPAALGGGEAYVDAFFPTTVNNALFMVGSNPGITTRFARLQDFYAGECVLDDTGHSYLEIRLRPQPGDQRTNPINFDHLTLNPAGLGTHILDYAFPLGELKSLVATKAAAMP